MCGFPPADVRGPVSMLDVLWQWGRSEFAMNGSPCLGEKRKEGGWSKHGSQDCDQCVILCVSDGAAPVTPRCHQAPAGPS